MAFSGTKLSFLKYLATDDQFHDFHRPTCDPRLTRIDKGTGDRRLPHKTGAPEHLQAGIRHAALQLAGRQLGDRCKC